MREEKCSREVLVGVKGIHSVLRVSLESTLLDLENEGIDARMSWTSGALSTLLHPKEWSAGSSTCSLLGDPTPLSLSCPFIPAGGIVTL